MEDKLLEMCKKVIDGETPRDSCQEVRCIDCPFEDEKIDCETNSIEIEEVAQKYIEEHEKTVNTIEKIEEKNKYKVGDKVRIRKDLESCKSYNGVWFTSWMNGEKGKESIVKEIWENDGEPRYVLINSNYTWSEDMLEPVEEEKITLKELQEMKKDNIIPPYYNKGNYDVIQFCLDNNIDFVSGNIIKYITRYKNKNGIEDLKKAKEYLKRLEQPTTISIIDLVLFTEENNLGYWQGKIIESVIDNNKDLANILIDKLIRKEESKEKEIEETYCAEGMAD